MASLNSPRTTADMEEILKTAGERAIRYVQMARERKVAPAEKDLATLTTFHEPFPAEGSNPADVVAMLDEFGSPATVATTGGRYFGFVTGGALPAAVGANWLAGVWDQNASLRVMSPIAAELEDVILAWICEALGLPMECE